MTGPLTGLGKPAIGTVTLVGGGPGDPGLMTLAGREAIEAADVILVDHLAPDPSRWARPGAEIIDVAKLPRGPAAEQAQINGLMVEHARAGRQVVRLKGGDSFVFGRGMEEIQACRAAGVPVHVIPGVSAATAVPALAGIPLTHRGVVQGFTVVSGHVPPEHPGSEIDYAALVASGTTLVILMGVRTLPAIMAALLDAGLDRSTPAAVIEDAGGPAQRVLLATADIIADEASRADVRPPAITVIGQVAGFADPSPEGGI